MRLSETLAATLATGALLCFFTGISCAQSAAPRKFYLGIDLGRAQVNPHWPEFRAPGEHDLGWKLRLGYQFTPGFSLEAAYTHFGEYQGSVPTLFTPASSGTAVAPGDFRTAASGMEVSGVGTFPLGEHFYVNASLGLARREFKTRLEPFFVGMPPGRLADGDLAVQLGAGFGFRMNQALDIGFSWVTTDNLAGDVQFRQNDANPEMVSLGLRFRL